MAGDTVTSNVGLRFRDEFGEQVETAVFAKFRANEAEVEGVVRLMLDSGFKMFFILSQDLSR